MNFNIFLIFCIYFKLTIKRIVLIFAKHAKKFANDDFRATFFQMTNYVYCAINCASLIEFWKKKIDLTKSNFVLKNVLSHLNFSNSNDFSSHFIFQIFIVNWITYNETMFVNWYRNQNIWSRKKNSCKKKLIAWKNAINFRKISNDFFFDWNSNQTRSFRQNQTYNFWIFENLRQNCWIKYYW